MYQFFKFCEINKYFIESLVNGTLYFAKPSELNDPFDCNLNIKKAIENAVKIYKGKKAKELIALLENSPLLQKVKRKISTAGICSFSLKLNNTLLWSHYANSHRGVCVLYDFPIPFFDDTKNIAGVSDVTYGDNPLTDWFLENNLPTSEDEIGRELLKRILTIKSPPWSYEEEARIIAPRSGSVNIPMSYLKQICFGLHTSKRDIALTRNIVDGLCYEVEYWKAVRSEDDFGVIYKEL